MDFNQSGTVFQCQCDDREFDEHLVASLVLWCKRTATGWHRSITSTSDYDLEDFDDGLLTVSKHWSVRIWFDNDAEAIAFRLALDGILAEAAC